MEIQGVTFKGLNYEAFIQGIGGQFPGMNITLDKLHVMMLLTKFHHWPIHIVCFANEV